VLLGHLHGLRRLRGTERSISGPLECKTKKEWSHQESNPRPQPAISEAPAAQWPVRQMLRLRATNCAIAPFIWTGKIIGYRTT
jgi:hypothetical protein